ncbi:MAG: AAA family ATPase [Candidatus Calescibacterium sp.]|nr:AAA family ATPase [Candidatus Calescibacterium sp.]MDW8194658.1 AAA family ATPase [Candidatus Calescibacterium sp.]
MGKKLPIGVSSFEKIRSDNYYYVDKTQYIKKLVDQGGYYFFHDHADLENHYF